MNSLHLKDTKDFREMVTGLQERTPGISEKTAEEMVSLIMGLYMVYPGISEDLMNQKTQERLAELVKDNVEWAREYLYHLTASTMRPAYDAAVRAGADPVRSIEAQFLVLYPTKTLPEGEAEAVVKMFREKDALDAANSTT